MSDLHAQIMNLPCSPQEPVIYRMGHRDARHAAAELANAYADELERKDAAIAELVTWLRWSVQRITQLSVQDSRQFEQAVEAIAKHQQPTTTKEQ